MDRPLPSFALSEFSVSFRTVTVDDFDSRIIAEWAHHFCRSKGSKSGPLFSINLFHETIKNLIKTESYIDVFEFDFDDLYKSFSKTAEKYFGEKTTKQVKSFIGELKFLVIKHKNEENKLLIINSTSSDQLNLSKWTIETFSKIENQLIILKPDKSWVKFENQFSFLSKLIDLYNLCLDSRQTALQSKKELIIFTLKKSISNLKVTH